MEKILGQHGECHQGLLRRIRILTAADYEKKLTTNPSPSLPNPKPESMEILPRRDTTSFNLVTAASDHGHA